MTFDYVESLTRNWNLAFWILMFFWETDRSRAVTFFWEGTLKVRFITTLNHSAFHWTVRNLGSCDNSVIRPKTHNMSEKPRQISFSRRLEANLCLNVWALIVGTFNSEYIPFSTMVQTQKSNARTDLKYQSCESTCKKRWTGEESCRLKTLPRVKICTPSQTTKVELFGSLSFSLERKCAWFFSI